MLLRTGCGKYQISGWLQLNKVEWCFIKIWYISHLLLYIICSEISSSFNLYDCFQISKL